MQRTSTFALVLFLTTSIFAQEDSPTFWALQGNLYVQHYNFDRLNQTLSDNDFPNLLNLVVEADLTFKRYQRFYKFVSTYSFFIGEYTLDNDFIETIDSNLVTKKSLKMRTFGIAGSVGGNWELRNGWYFEALLGVEVSFSNLKTYQNIPESISFDNILNSEIQEDKFARWGIHLTPKLAFNKFFEEGYQVGFSIRYRSDLFDHEWRYHDAFPVYNIRETRLRGIAIGFSFGTDLIQKTRHN